ncbi:MAG: electron transport complex subunit RsxB [Pseudomonadales bacterium]|nr:electron transport complex subunit RsxB [Pseudomonadales bacterium]
MLLLIDQVFIQLGIAFVGALLFWRLLLNIYVLLVTQTARQKSFIDKINRCLPQTQCGQCGYEGCRPYAKAIANGDAINRCPPGGNETILKLAQLANEPLARLDPAHGNIAPLLVAVIREDECIGCTKCIVACPVDAIIGGPKLMHTVIESECTGCDLCVDPCPVDCIDMINSTDKSIPTWTLPTTSGALATQLEAGS